MKIEIEIDERKLRQIIIEHLREKLGDIRIDEADVKIEVKSKQNYRAEWESARFRARYLKLDA